MNRSTLTTCTLACLAGLLGLLPPPARAAGLAVSTDKFAIAANSGEALAINIDLPEPVNFTAKVFDAKGNFVRLLAGKAPAESRLQVPWNLKDASGNPVAPGDYVVKVQTGIRLIPDRGFGKDGVFTEPAAVSPWALCVDRMGNLYLFDKATSTVFKYASDGSPIKDWNGKNTIAAPSAPFWGSLAVEDDGSRLYLPETFTTSHVIDVYDGNSGAALKSIGGFFGDDAAWKKTKGGIAYPNVVALGGNHRLYTDSPGYGSFFAFDRTKEGKEAGVWIMGYDQATHGGWSSPGDAMATDGKSALYMAAAAYANRAPIYKFIDLGDTCKFAYAFEKYIDPATKKDVMIDDVMGLGYDGQGGLFAVERAHSQLLLISDNGAGMDFVAAWGTRGTDSPEFKFQGLHAVAVGPGAKTLYVVEDGEPMSKTDTAPGQAHVTRYKISYDEEKSVRINVH